MVEFQKSAQLLTVPTSVTSVSEDKQAASVVFNNLSLSLEGFKGQFVETKVQSLSFKLENNQEKTVISQIIRGNAQTATGTNAVLIIHSGDRTVSVNFDEPNKDFCESFDTTVLPRANYLITFVLLLEKKLDEPDSGALLTIDSLDLEFASKKEES